MRSSCSGKPIDNRFIVNIAQCAHKNDLLIIQFNKAEFNREKNISSCSYLL